jgi:hypothetical protein
LLQNLTASASSLSFARFVRLQKGGKKIPFQFNLVSFCFWFVNQIWHFFPLEVRKAARSMRLEKEDPNTLFFPASLCYSEISISRHGGIPPLKSGLC